MHKFTFIIFIIISIIKLMQTQSTPQVSCPDLFQYVESSRTREIEGQIKYYITEAGKTKISIKMVYPSGVTPEHAGTIKLMKNLDETATDILQNRPIVIEIQFPTANPLPTIKEITSNNEIICSNRIPTNHGSEIFLSQELDIPKEIILAAKSNPKTKPTNPPTKKPTEINFFSYESSTLSKIDSTDFVECGKTVVPTNLIIGGDKINPGSWPWLVAMFARGNKRTFSYICSGNLVSQQAIISAAHCVSTSGKIRNVNDIRIGLGMHNLENWDEPNSQIARVVDIIVHPEYGLTRIYDADIAILILDRRYSYTNFIRPVYMWRNELDSRSNREGQVAGWGYAGNSNSYENEPSIIGAEIVDGETCLRSNLAFNGFTSNRNLCAGYRNNTGPCRGDSGSGLIIEIGGSWYLRATVAGALSHAGNQCDLREYVIYSDVDKFTDWIRRNI